MSTLTQTATAWARWVTRRRVAIILALAVLGWSLVELASLVFNHTVGPEVYGILAAALAVGAAAADVALLWSAGSRKLATAAVLVLWAIVALGGIAGTYYHVVGMAPEYGPVDPRSRPALAPLVFTALALVGAASLFFGQRSRRPS